MSGEGIINKRYNLTPAAGSSIFKPVDKLNDEELRAVLNAPVNELRNRIKGKG
jgi:aspartate/tyrosine/aromatic aminotransferase